MKRALIWIVLMLLTLAGVGGVIGYVVALFYEADTDRLVTDYGALAAFSAVAAIAGGLSLLAMLGRLPRTVRLPNEWLSLSLFVLVIGAGYASVYYDRYLALAPLLAIIAAAALFGFMGRVILRWTPDSRVDGRGFILPAVWGMVGAPLTAVVAQMVTLVMLVSAGVAGLYLADPNAIDNVDEWLAEASELTDLSIIQTPTIAFGALSMLGVAAPLTEELAKFLGVYLVFRNRAATKLGLFAAGAAAGLGFAVVETLGYALMTLDQWPQVMLLRAPVAFIHVAATTMVALGWYKQRESGGYWLAGFFVLSVLLHGAWNSLFVSLLILAGGIETPDAIEPWTALMTLVVVSAMGGVFVAAVMWIVSNARRLGREAAAARQAGAGAPVPVGIARASSY